MGVLNWLGIGKKKQNVKTTQKYQMVSDNGGGFFSWNGNLYQSDIVRSAIRPKAQAVGKAVAKHVRQNVKEADQENPDVYMKFLLEEPNPYMTGQVFQEKMITQLELNNNAFAYINRDENGLPIELYPIVPMGVQVVLDDRQRLYLRFTRQDGKTVTFKYTDIIHLRKDFNSNELFGEPNGEALTNLMEVVNTTDQGIITAIKNSNIIRWLLKFNSALRPEDIRKQTKQFVEDFMEVDNEDGVVGAAGVDSKMDATQVEPKNYVPSEDQTAGTLERIYSFFNTNKKIIQGNYTENEWISYYEANIQPIVQQMSNEYTRKLFSRRQRGHGNKIIFESSSLEFASMSTKMKLVQFVDRGLMSDNEVRRILGLSAKPDGDTYVRRLDTVPINENSGKDADPEEGSDDE